MCVLPRNSPALDSSNTSFFSRSNWFMSKIVVRCDWPIQLLLFGCYETINYKVPLCVSLHDISVQGFQYIRYTSYPRLTWLGSIGRTRLRRLENWHSNTRFQVFTCSRTNWGLEVLLLKRLRGKPGAPGENLAQQGGDQQKRRPHPASTLGLKPRPHWWGESAITTAPLLLPYPLLPPVTFPLPSKRLLCRLTISPQSLHSPY